MSLFFGRIHFFFLRRYDEILTRFTPPLDDRDLPPIPCQFCGGSHSEKYCSKGGNYMQILFTRPFFIIEFIGRFVIIHFFA